MPARPPVSQFASLLQRSSFAAGWSSSRLQPALPRRVHEITAPPISFLRGSQVPLRAPRVSRPHRRTPRHIVAHTGWPLISCLQTPAPPHRVVGPCVDSGPPLCPPVALPSRHHLCPSEGRERRPRAGGPAPSQPGPDSTRLTARPPPPGRTRPHLTVGEARDKEDKGKGAVAGSVPPLRGCRAVVEVKQNIGTAKKFTWPLPHDGST